jgi:hypothetical protein
VVARKKAYIIRTYGYLDGIKAAMHYSLDNLDKTMPPDYIETFTAALDAAQVNYTNTNDIRVPGRRKRRLPRRRRKSLSG